MEDAYIIKGGIPLVGEIRLSGAKNVALKAIIAAILFDNQVTLHNVPKIKDVYELLHLIKKLGVKADFVKDNTVIINSTMIKNNMLDFLHASRIRTSFMLFAPLLYKFKKAYIPNPGGCRLGARSIDRIVDGMKALGVKIEYNSNSGYYEAILSGKPHGEYKFKKSSHTGTELLILLSIFAKGRVIIHNAAQEPEIDNLILFLNQGGAKIKRNSSQIIIDGVTRLIQKKAFTLISDRNEAITYAIAALVTQGSVIISPIDESSFITFIDYVKRAGGGIKKLTKNKWQIYYKGPIKAVDISTSPHPGFMTDWQPNWAVLMTQASGQSIIHERVFENRFAYVEELKKLGAKIEFIKKKIINPKKFYLFNYDEKKEYQQIIKIYGQHKLHGGVLSITDLRAGATLAIASLLADGESVVSGVSILERGYENFVEKIRSLGGDIKKV